MNVKLRNLREQNGVSQSFLGDLLNISQSQYQRKEVGYSNFTAGEYEILAGFFKVDQAEICESVIKSDHFSNKSTIYYLTDKLIDEVKDMIVMLKSDLKEQKEENKRLHEVINQYRNSGRV
jgi:transcriptional regulator with XRE-family HTH domain